MISYLVASISSNIHFLQSTQIVVITIPRQQPTLLSPISTSSASPQPNSNHDPLIILPQQQHLSNPDAIRKQPVIDNNAIFLNGETGTEESENYSTGLNSTVIKLKKSIKTSFVLSIYYFVLG